MYDYNDYNYTGPHPSQTNRSFAAHQIIQYNDLLIETQRLREDNHIFLQRIEKYQNL